MDANWIASSTVNQVQKYALKANHQKELVFLNVFNTYPYHAYLLTDASWFADTLSGRGGFYITKGFKRITVAGCSSNYNESAFEVEVSALEPGLKIATDWRINITVIFTDYLEIQNVWNLPENMSPEGMHKKIHNLKCLYDLHRAQIEVIPREGNDLADKLAAQGRAWHELSLFHHGMDLPSWLMKWLHKNCYTLV